MSDRSGENNPNWRGGRYTAVSGYVRVWVGRDHHLADPKGYAYEHRLVAEEKLGRRLRPGEQIHHLDGDRANNASKNIEVTASQHEHSLRHRPPGCVRRLPGEPNPTVECLCGCGGTFLRYDGRGRPRSYLPHHGAKRRQVTARPGVAA